MISSNITSNGNGHLAFAGVDTVELAAQYKTPLYLMDEDRIRHNCRIYTDTLKNCFGEGAMALYASKAASFKQICKIISDEGMGIDLVSPGEIYTAVQAGFPMEKAYFHGNNKTDEDIAFAMENHVGHFVVDGKDELDAVERLAAERDFRQKILLRLTPGIDTHTYEAINTGKVDSKFGTAIETGQAMELAEYTLSLRHIELEGFHCHIGSQVFEEDVYQRTSFIMLGFFAEVQRRLGYTTRVFDIGGGYGVRYVEADGEQNISARLSEVAEYIKATSAKLGIAVPFVLVEPGRSIVADAGMTLYKVGAVKKIPEYRNYVSVDGGMTDNPRYALYGAEYTVYCANRILEPLQEKYDVVGRCCESGDIIQPNVSLPLVSRGDILAVCTTGAYNYSMASNYNRICRPALVMLSGGKSTVAVRRESIDDLLRNDI